jgi:hypothetical protein
MADGFESVIKSFEQAAELLTKLGAAADAENGPDSPEKIAQAVGLDIGSMMDGQTPLSADPEGAELEATELHLTGGAKLAKAIESKLGEMLS